MRYYLTDRQKEVLDYLCHGYSYDDIAKILFVSDKTVRSHVTAIFSRLGVHSQTQAVIKAIDENLVQLRSKGIFYGKAYESQT